VIHLQSNSCMYISCSELRTSLLWTLLAFVKVQCADLLDLWPLAWGYHVYNRTRKGAFYRLAPWAFI